MKNITIVGSRRYPRLDLIPHLFFGLLPPGRHIYTGDASGVDATVADWVSRLATNPLALHTLTVMPAAWSKLGKSAGSVRNQALIHAADAIIAFWDLHSPGTTQMIDLATARAMPLYVYDPRGRLLPAPLTLFGSASDPFLPDMSGPEYLPLSDPASTALPRGACALA